MLAMGKKLEDLQSDIAGHLTRLDDNGQTMLEMGKEIEELRAVLNVLLERSNSSLSMTAVLEKTP